MDRIGIINCSHIINYGSVLQSYATERIVRQLTGTYVCSIRYQQKKDMRYIKNYFRAIFNKDILLMKIKGIKKESYLFLFDRYRYKKCKHRKMKFEEFVNDNFVFADTITGWNELINSSNKFDCVVLGSDQVWHPINYGSHFYTMEWVADCVPKITYAASFGVSNLPRYQLQGTIGFLKRIEHISVREHRGAEIVDSLIGIKPQVVVDPTLLLGQNEWDMVCKPIKKEHYIFCYFLGNSKYAREYSRKIASEIGLPIYAILYMDEVNKIDKKFADKEIYDAGPGEFISLIKNADYIITDSFHGSVFSIIYHKKFVVFDRFDHKTKLSTNSRIDTLLKSLKIENRRYTENNKIEVGEEIDYENVDKILSVLRNESIEFLQNGLNEVKLSATSK